MVEVPGRNAIQLPLPILAALDGRPSDVVGGISVQPLLAECGKEGGEERSSEACVEDSFDQDDRAWGTVPHRDCGNVTAESGAVDLLNKDAKESSGFLIWVWLQLGIYLGDKRGGDGGEQTGLHRKSTRV